MMDPTWAGTDEVGRGCLAGPVVAAAVAWREGKPPPWVGELRDSKKLSPNRREVLAKRLVAAAEVRWSLAWRGIVEIDTQNILQASLSAMSDALSQLGELAGVYVDGNQKLPIGLPQETVIGGDDRIPQIAAASIVAKVFRDRWMENLDREFPGYNWTGNRGYGTPDHLEALQRLGPSPQHRRSFAPVRQMALFTA